uniref:Uncharacterized protein n=1 Tax=Arundo donax TaxID=35708 RepID=A0A0A9DV90_ARUDO
MSSWEWDEEERNRVMKFLDYILKATSPIPSPAATTSHSGSDSDSDSSSSLPSSTHSPAASFSSDGGLADHPSLVALEDSVDRITGLSSPLVREILRRLTIKEAARTGVLSTSWKGVWPDAPLGTLRDVDLLADGDWLEMARSNNSLLPSMMKSLAAHRVQIRRAQITNIAFGGHAEELRQLILSLADKQVEDLVLANFPFPYGVPLPAEIFGCPSLQRVVLGLWEFPSSAACLNAFTNVQELVIFHSVVRDADLSALVQHCPVLEILSVVLARVHPSKVEPHCHTLEVSSRSLRVAVDWMSEYREVTVKHTPSLQRLLLHNSSCSRVVRITATPKLEVLGFLDLGKHELWFNGTQITVGMDVTACVEMPSVKVLGVKVDFAQNTEARLLPALLNCFPHLETLHVMSVRAQSSGSIDGGLGAEFWESHCGTECLGFHLRTIVLHGFLGRQNEMDYLRYLVREGSVISTLGLVCEGGLLQRQWALSSTDGTPARIIVEPETAHLSFYALMGPMAVNRDPFKTLAIHVGDNPEHGLEYLPSIFKEANRGTECNAAVESGIESSVSIRLASHTWSFQTATNLSFEDPFCELRDPVA